MHTTDTLSPHPSPQRSNSWFAPGHLWLILCCALAVVHVTQAIWVSRGEAYPGDLGDARFNNLVLEHGYLALRGAYEWSSPGQFHPLTDTLGFSDTHAGTLPLYAAARFAGLSVERSWQFWFLAVATLNTIAMARLLGALRIRPLLAGPLVFLACAPPTMVWYAGSHAQILAMFPALFALDQCVRLAFDGKTSRLVTAAGWSCWQFAASPYLAALSFLLFVPAALLWAGLAVFQPTIRPVLRWRPTPGEAFRAVAVAMIGASLAGVAIHTFREATTRHGATGGMHDLLVLAPDWRSWFSSPAGHWLYPTSWPAGNPNWIEQCLFFGFMPLILARWGLGRALRERRLPEAAVALSCGGAALAGMLFFTQWGTGAQGGFLWLAEHVPAFRAFRASGRVVAFIPVLVAVPIGVGLQSWIAERRSLRRVAAATGLLLVALAEAIAVHQPTVSVAEAQARTAALAEAWTANGDRPFLLFAPGLNNQGSDRPQLDAWSAAMALRRRTVNGYSGRHPGELEPFLSEPTLRNGRELLARLGIPAEQVSVVDRWPATTAAKFGYVRFGEGPDRPLEGLGLQPSWWRVFHLMETCDIGGIRAYRFLPPAEVHFPLPDEASGLRFHAGLTPGTFEEPGRSEGVGFECRVRSDAGEVFVTREFLDARDERLRQGLRSFAFDLPPGRARVLILRVDAGPTGRYDWDNPLFGGFEATR